MNKNKTIILTIIVAIVLVGLGIYLKNQTPAPVTQTISTSTTTASTFDPKSLKVLVDGNPTQYFGNEAYGDLNGDGLQDIAFLVTYDGGGSGTFYYAVAGIKTENDYKVTNPFLIGDRIAPQSTYIPTNSREIQVNYAERRPGEPMTTPPSQGATLLLKVTPEGVLEGLMK